MKPHLTLALPLVLTFVACASDMGQAPNRQAGAALPAPQSDIRELSPQQLKPGTCGLFLWTIGTPRRFVFFSEAASPTAKAYLGESESVLTLVASRGDVFGEFLTEAEYHSAEGMDVRLSIVPGEMLEDGQRVSSGSLVLKDMAGWESVFPVAGLRACMPAS